MAEVPVLVDVLPTEPWARLLAEWPGVEVDLLNPVTTSASWLVVAHWSSVLRAQMGVQLVADNASSGSGSRW